ncbi:MAG: hypothetical protein QXP70_03560 [Methanomassiliicoccales archaeon]
MSYVRRYRVAGLGLILIGTAFVLAALAVLSASSALSLLGLVLDILGILFFFAEWPRYGPVQRRYTAGAAFVFVAALIINLLTGAIAFNFGLGLNAGVQYTFPQAVKAVGGAFSGLLFYLSYFLLASTFCKSEERSILVAGAVGGAIASVILNPIVIAGTSIPDFAYYVNLFVQIVSILLGIAYIMAGLHLVR